MSDEYSLYMHKHTHTNTNTHTLPHSGAVALIYVHTYLQVVTHANTEKALSEKALAAKSA